MEWLNPSNCNTLHIFTYSGEGIKHQYTICDIVYNAYHFHIAIKLKSGKQKPTLFVYFKFNPH